MLSPPPLYGIGTHRGGPVVTRRPRGRTSWVRGRRVQSSALRSIPARPPSREEVVRCLERVARARRGDRPGRRLAAFRRRDSRRRRVGDQAALPRHESPRLGGHHRASPGRRHVVCQLRPAGRGRDRPGATNTFPCSFDLDTRDLSDGPHRIRVEVYSAAGLLASSKDRTIYVHNAWAKRSGQAAGTGAWRRKRHRPDSRGLRAGENLRLRARQSAFAAEPVSPAAGLSPNRARLFPRRPSRYYPRRP